MHCLNRPDVLDDRVKGPHRALPAAHGRTGPRTSGLPRGASHTAVCSDLLDVHAGPVFASSGRSPLGGRRGSTASMTHRRCAVAGPPPADALLFAARRLRADPAGIVFAAMTTASNSRRPASRTCCSRASMTLSVAQILDRYAPGLAAAVRQRLLIEAAGKSTRAGRLTRGLSTSELRGGAPLPVVIPLPTRLVSTPVIAGDSAGGHPALLVVSGVMRMCKSHITRPCLAYGWKNPRGRSSCV